MPPPLGREVEGRSPGAVDLAERHWVGDCDCAAGDDGDADISGQCSCPASNGSEAPFLSGGPPCSHYCIVHDQFHCAFCFTQHHIHFAGEAAADRHDCAGLWDNLYEHALAHVSPWQSFDYLNGLLLDGYDGGWDDAYLAWSEHVGPGGGSELF